VTGVQTCALPISSSSSTGRRVSICPPATTRPVPNSANPARPKTVNRTPPIPPPSVRPPATNAADAASRISVASSCQTSRHDARTRTAHGAPARTPGSTDSSGTAPTGPPPLDRAQQAVPHRQQHRDEPLVVPDHPVHLADRLGVGVAVLGVGDPVVPQRVVERDHAARPQQPQRVDQVIGVLALLRVAEHHVVGAV